MPGYEAASMIPFLKTNIENETWQMQNSTSDIHWKYCKTS